MTAEAGAADRQVRRQIVDTAAVVFIAFLLLAVHSTMFMLANALEDCGITSPYHTDLCSSCYNDYALIRR